MVMQNVAQWWFDLLDMFGWFSRDVHNGLDKPGYRLILNDNLTSFDNWEWHEPWGDQRGVTKFGPDQRETRTYDNYARLRMDFGLQGYRAGMLFSRHTYRFGWYEMRARMPQYPVAAAFWMYTPSGVPYHEVDIAEFAPANGAGVIDFAYHKAINDSWVSPFIVKINCGESFLGKWHTYALHWTPYCLTFYIDNALLYSSLWTAPRESMHIVAHLQADEAYRPNQVPAYLEIDYIRVWEAA